MEELNGPELRIRHPLDSEDSSESLDVGDISLEGATGCDLSDPEEDKSLYQAVLSPDNQDCRLQKGKRIIIPERLNDKIYETVLSPDKNGRRTIVPVREIINSDLDDTLSQLSETDDELETSILDQLEQVEPISEYTAEEEREDVRSWKSVDLGGNERTIDMKVIEPYKRVLSHGGYLNSGSRNAIIVLSACYLPNRSRVDYNYVMDNLSSYILATLDELVTDDYILIYLHGGSPKDCIPTFSWIKKCYKIIDRRLRKQLKQLYLVHPTLMLKAFVTMSRFFVSSKFLNKVHFVNSLAELYELLPLEQASIPERVCHYDRIRQSIQTEAV